MTEMVEVNNEIEQTSENTADEKFLIFSILGRRFAFMSRFIGEITLFETVYPLPLMPPYVPGVINRYSVPYALFDIGLLLFKTPSPRTKVLVLKDNIDRIAFLIDDIIGIADIPQKELLSVERAAESGDITEAVSASFNWDGGDVFVLDVQRILSQAAGRAI
jgi:purine-binding chemotaxis protein CheW